MHCLTPSKLLTLMHSLKKHTLTSIQCKFGAPLDRQELHVLVIVLRKVLLLHLPHTLPQPE